MFSKILALMKIVFPIPLSLFRSRCITESMLPWDYQFVKTEVQLMLCNLRVSLDLYHLLFSTVFIIWKENDSLNTNVFLVYLPIENVRTVLTLKIFNHQIIANLPYTAIEIVRFLKYVRKFFFRKSWDFLKKHF